MPSAAFGVIAQDDAHPPQPWRTLTESEQAAFDLGHRMGEDLSDRDVAGEVALSEFRTAPLWGINASMASGRALRLMHDGRARSIEEAIAWHGGARAASRAAFEKLSKEDRDTLLAWIATL